MRNEKKTKEVVVNDEKKTKEVVVNDEKKTKDVVGEKKTKEVDDHQNSTETIIKKENLLEVSETTQKLIEMYEANTRVLEQLRRQQTNYVVESPDDDPSSVDIEDLQMCYNQVRLNSFPTQFPQERHSFARSLMDNDSFTGSLKKGEHIIIGEIHDGVLLFDIQLWFDNKVNDVRVGNALDDSLYLNVSGYDMVRTSLSGSGRFESQTSRVGMETSHILLSLGHDFTGSFKVRITYSR